MTAYASKVFYTIKKISTSYHNLTHQSKFIC